MDYAFISKYDLNYKIPKNSNSYFIRTDSAILEYKLLQPVKNIKLSTHRVFSNNKLKFVLYKKKLEIYEDKKLINKLKSNYPILVCNGIFLVREQEDNKAKVVNAKGNINDTIYKENCLFYTERGVMFYVKRDQGLANKCDCIDNCNLPARRGVLYQGNLASSFFDQKIIYNYDGKKVELNDITILKDCASIKNIFDLNVIIIDGKEFIIVLTINAFFIIHDDIIIKKSVSDYNYIAPNRNVIHDFIKEMSYSSLFMYFNIYFSLSPVGKTSEVEIVNFYNLKESNQKLTDTFLLFLNNLRPFQNVLCKAYRLLDDKGKNEVLQFINIELLDSECLSLIIQFHYDLIEMLVSKCIRENRLDILKDTYDYFKNIENVDVIRLTLLRNNILFEKIEGFEDIYEMQMYEVEASRNYFNPQSTDLFDNNFFK